MAPLSWYCFQDRTAEASWVAGNSWKFETLSFFQVILSTKTVLIDKNLRLHLITLNFNLNLIILQITFQFILKHFSYLLTSLELTFMPDAIRQRSDLSGLVETQSESAEVFELLEKEIDRSLRNQIGILLVNVNYIRTFLVHELKEVSFTDILWVAYFSPKSSFRDIKLDHKISITFQLTPRFNRRLLIHTQRIKLVRFQISKLIQILRFIQE